MENLRCTVTSCHYNSEQLCTAEKVQVYSIGDGFANTSDGTGCKTFKPKSSSNNLSQWH